MMCTYIWHHNGDIEQERGGGVVAVESGIDQKVRNDLNIS